MLPLPPACRCYLGFALTRDISMTCFPLLLLATPPALPGLSLQDAFGEGAGCGSLLPAPSPSAGPPTDGFPGLPAVGRSGAACLCRSRAQRGERRLLSGALLPRVLPCCTKLTCASGQEGTGRCGAELLIRGCLIRKTALDLEGTISTFIF